MVKKLIKHEIFAYIRILVPTYIVLLGIALIGRMIQIFESDSDIYSLVFGSSVFAFIVSIMAALGITFAFGIIRFYKNLFTGEGYLTFALPVTVSQHILVKGIVAVIAQFATLIVAVLSVIVMTFGEVAVEIFKAVGYLILLKPEHICFHIVEGIILLAVGLFGGYMLYYLCISIGQLFNKNRVFCSVGVYFAYYMLVQMISTVFTVIFSVYYDYLPLKEIGEFIEKNPYESIHIFMGIGIIWNLIIGTVYFIISKMILTKRLNLE